MKNISSVLGLVIVVALACGMIISKSFTKKWVKHFDGPPSEMCNEAITFPDRHSCENRKDVQKGDCLKSRDGWCYSECGRIVHEQIATNLLGSCFPPGASAYMVSVALHGSGCHRFRNERKASSIVKQLEEWGFKKYPPSELGKIEGGAILHFASHLAIYRGNGKIIDAAPGWYGKCKLEKTRASFKKVFGAKDSCASGRLFLKGLTKRPSPYSRVLCITEHSFKKGKAYKGHPLLAFYQRR